MGEFAIGESAIGEFAMGEFAIGEFAIGEFAIGDNLETHLQTTDYPYALQGTAYRLPDQREGEKFKSLYGYVLSLSIDKLNTAIYVSFQTEKFLDISKSVLDRSNLFHMKLSLSPNCMRAIFRSEEIRYPTKKKLFISEAVFMFHIKHMLYIKQIKSICLYSCRASVMV